MPPLDLEHGSRDGWQERLDSMLVLRSLDAGMVRELGIPLGHAIRLVEHIKAALRMLAE